MEKDFPIPQSGQCAVLVRGEGTSGRCSGSTYTHWKLPNGCLIELCVVHFHAASRVRKQYGQKQMDATRASDS